MNIRRKSIAMILSALFFMMQAMPLRSFATEITGVTGNNGVYNIDPTALITGSDIGYRKYIDFILSQGDIANLIFKYGDTDISTFINLVDNKISINGIINSMRHGNFYNGRAIFVSPNGMVIGSSGVINVGSLGVYTPTAAVYNDYKNNPHADLNVLKASNNNGSVTINGKVIATNDIDIHSGSIDINKSGGMLAGTGNNIVVDSNQRAEEIFNNIVNTKNIHSANNVSNTNGNITLTSTVGTTVAGMMNNYGKGNTTITNTGSKGVKISGTSENHNGNYTILNKNGNLEISGTLINRNGTMALTNNGNTLTVTKTGKIDNSDELQITNTGKGGMQLNGSIVNKGNTNILNTAGALNLGGSFSNTKNTTIEQRGNDDLTITANVNNRQDLTITNKGNNLVIAKNATIKNGRDLNITNSGKGNLMIAGNVTNERNSKITNNNGSLHLDGSFVNKNDSTWVNNGKGDFVIAGDLKNGRDLTLTNNGNALLLVKNHTIQNGRDINITNTGKGGLQLAGNVVNGRNSQVINKNGSLNVMGSYKNNNGDATFDNSGDGSLNVTGSIENKGGTLKIYNKNNALNIAKGATVSNTGYTHIKNDGENGLNIDGQVINGNNILVENTGAKGLNVNGSVNADGNITLRNEGDAGVNINGTVTAKKNGNNNSGNVTVIHENNDDGGINLNSSGRINAENDIRLSNSYGSSGIHVKGLMKANNNVDIYNGYSHVIIGDDTDNNEYITAGNNVNINVLEGSILNWAGFEGHTGPMGIQDAKTLIKAGGNLTMDVTSGTIGQEVGAGCYSDYCTGISDAPGTRDYSKSINANVGGTVTATTTDTYPGGIRDLVINYAAINSDMNIDHIKADGRVILTTDYDQRDGKTRYDMINASTDPTKANVEGWGISLISSGNIGSKDNKLTFNQTQAGELATTENPIPKNGYGMDVLANEDIYIKGLDDKYTVNNVCSMISREGNIDAEFSGNTYIDEITAEGDINIVTRGKTLEINHLGTVPNTPVDYFGPRTQGQKDGGYMEPDLRDETLPNHVTLAALDINKNIRPDGEMVDGHYAWADSTVTVRNAQLDNGTLDITADNIYANGVEAHFNRDGFSKQENNSTNPVIGASEIPTGHAVRPSDVSAIGRDVHERNYYYPEGDGDGIFNGQPSNVDPDNNIAEATPLAIPDRIGPGPGPEPEQQPDRQSGDITFIQRKIVDSSVDAVDKRQYMRFKVSDNTNPVLLEKQNNGVDSLLDVSRGGIAVRHNNSLKVGDVVPVHLAYGDLDINANVKIVSATSSRAGAEFVNIDKALANQLLYLSILLESNNNMLAANF